MNAGRGLDALIAEKVMGLRLDYEFSEEMGAPAVPELRDQYDEWGVLPNYSTDMACAWQVVTHMTRKDRAREESDLYFKLTYAWDDDYGCWASFDWKGVADTHPLYQGHADTAPHAICLAALRAVGVEL